MPDHTSHHRAVTIDDLIDDVLRPVLVDRLEEFYAEVERHDREVRAITDRVHKQMQGQFQAILKGHTGEPEESGFGVAAEMDVLRIRTHEAVCAALEAEHAEHHRRVAGLNRGKGKTMGEANE